MTAQSNGRGNQSHGSSLLEGKLAVVFGAGGSIGESPKSSRLKAFGKERSWQRSFLETIHR